MAVVFFGVGVVDVDVVGVDRIVGGTVVAPARVAAAAVLGLDVVVGRRRWWGSGHSNGLATAGLFRLHLGWRRGRDRRGVVVAGNRQQRLWWWRAEVKSSGRDWELVLLLLG